MLIHPNNAYKIHEVGSIKLRLYVVQYVPNLKKNLISLETLESKGFKIIMAGGVIKIVLGALTVMKGTHMVICNFLQGNTIAGGDQQPRINFPVKFLIPESSGI